MRLVLLLLRAGMDMGASCCDSEARRLGLLRLRRGAAGPLDAAASKRKGLLCCRQGARKALPAALAFPVCQRFLLAGIRRRCCMVRLLSAAESTEEKDKEDALLNMDTTEDDDGKAKSKGAKLLFESLDKVVMAVGIFEKE